MPKSKKGQEAIENYFYDAGKGLLSIIPMWGPIAAYIFGELVEHPLEVRRKEWMENISLKLNELEQRNAGLIDNLKNDSGFLDILYQVSSIAIRNSDKEKLDALKNCVINSVFDTELDYSSKQIFINFVDQMTPLHLSVLKFMHNPQVYFEKNNIIVESLLYENFTTLLLLAFPELKGKEPYFQFVGKELYRMGMHLKDEDLKETGDLNSLLSCQTTEFGKLFLKFISEPQG